ncbi:hypothetical protein [Alicyclobacillus dauci]|uniref:Uncharacterized protein n=1 Tax=Alicyclobacillus dauci TaxID=1475485 RepID=A0ABY6Z4A3_9BACL|nr:hypothetical protein [Alicyclobacillus dauci]WAH37492.1 hypothetical protein NZD86_02840 [Alicyclobacillus dauci]
MMWGQHNLTEGRTLTSFTGINPKAICFRTFSLEIGIVSNWFVKWLREYAEKQRQKAQEHEQELAEIEYREKPGTLLDTIFRERGLRERVKSLTDNAAELDKWADLVEDMSNVGLLNSAIEYYDAKKRVDGGLPARPKNRTFFVVNDIVSEIEEIKDNVDEEWLEELNSVITTVSELLDAGMDEQALIYYLRARRKYPDLLLPEPKEQLD